MRKMFVVAIAAAMTLTLGACASSSDNSSNSGSGIKIGFIYVSPLKGSGWTTAWDQTRKSLETDFNATTSAVEPIPETADCVGVLKNLISKGNKIIFATAFGYQPFVAQVATENPKVTFAVIGPWAQKEAPPANVSVISNDSWATRYALGVLAANMTKTKTLGFVAANPIPSVIASINAFELGARSVDPTIKTRAVFTGTWYDPARATQAAQSLAQAGADVIAQYEDSTGTLLGAQKANVLGIGSEVDSSTVLPDTYLSGSVNDWHEFAKKLVQSVTDGSYQQINEVGTIASGVAALGAISPKVPADVKAKVEKTLAGLSDNSIVPFSGPLKSNTGKELLKPGEQWKDSVTVFGKQTFLVEGVIGKIPG